MYIEKPVSFNAFSLHLKQHVGKNKQKGFTIVELLIVVVVVIIAILAAITIASYNGIQSKARFSKTRSDIASLQKYI